MANLKKLKLIATRCTVSESSTRSPSRSPVVHLHRRKTLRMLLTRNATTSRPDYNSGNGDRDGESKPELKLSRLKLKELLVSSPPVDEAKRNSEEKEKEGENLMQASSQGNESGWRRGRSGSLRPLSAAIRNRLLLRRRAWRPVLGTIAE